MWVWGLHRVGRAAAAARGQATVESLRHTLDSVDEAPLSVARGHPLAHSTDKPCVHAINRSAGLSAVEVLGFDDVSSNLIEVILRGVLCVHGCGVAGVIVRAGLGSEVRRQDYLHCEPGIVHLQLKPVYRKGCVAAGP